MQGRLRNILFYNINVMSATDFCRTFFKKSEKSYKKALTKAKECGILLKLSQKRVNES